MPPSKQPRQEQHTHLNQIFISPTRMIHRSVKNFLRRIDWQRIRTEVRQIDWGPYREPRFVVAVVTATAFLIVSGGYIRWNMKQVNPWDEVFRNGTYIGLVPNDNQTLGKMKRLSAGYSIDLQLVPVHQKVPENYNWHSITELPTAAYGIFLNGTPLVYTSNATSAHTVVTDAKHALEPKNLSATATVQFVGKVTVRKTRVGVANIRSAQDAVDYILHPTERYQVVSRYADPFPNASQASSQSNYSSGTTSNTDANRPATSSLLTVTASEVVTTKVQQQFPVKIQKDVHLSAGTIKVTQKGVTGITKETRRLTYKNGKLISNRILSESELRPVREQIEVLGIGLYHAIMTQALKYQGYPYVYGGNSPQTGFDCSGLTQWVYGKLGISLPRTAQDQWNVATHVPQSKAKPGDLVFFSGTYGDAGSVVTHVGIYVGNGMMYDSDNAGVGYHSLAGYWQQHLYGFGRVTS